MYQGLSKSEVEKNRKTYGSNEITSAKQNS